MRSPAEGLVADGVTDRESLETLVSLRRRYLLDGANSTEVFDGALDDPGLVQT